jgi:hypothetical protein
MADGSDGGSSGASSGRLRCFASRWNGAEGCASSFYSPKAIPRKEGKDLDSDSIGGNDGRKSDSRRGKEEDVV